MIRFLILGIAFAAPCGAAEPFEPYEGQPGKDVVWVPTPRALVDKMLDLAGVTARDFVVDFRPGVGIRISPHFYNTGDEIDRLLAEMARIVEQKDYAIDGPVRSVVT